MYNEKGDGMIRLLISDPSLVLQAKISEYSKAVIEEKNDFNYCTFDFEINPLDEIIECLQSPAFGSEKKVVICKNPYFLKESKIKLPFVNNLEQLEKYLYHPNDDSEFIIVCYKNYFSSKSKFYSIINKVGIVENLLFENVDELTDYAKILKEKMKMDMDNNAMELLIERCDLDVCRLEREMTKLSLYGSKITKEIVNQMVAKPLEDDVFELSNALLKKDQKNIMRIYHDLKLLKIEPIYLISLLANQFRLLLQVAILKKENKMDNEIANLLSIHPYRVKLAKDYCRQYPIAQIKDILCELATLDYEIKIGKKDRYVDFELFLATK